jgi:CubicO group peptidase (beta-lactamase class C family)
MPTTTARRPVHPRLIPDEVTRRFARRLDRALGGLPAPGLNAAILVDDVVAWRYATGFARYRPEEPLTSRHLQRIGSITKLFTAHAVLMLRDEGRLDLDAPLRDVVPEFAPAGGERVTLRHVLCHGAGIASNGGEDVWGSGRFPDDAQFREAIRGYRLVAPPMVHLKYSNAAYSMLGLVIRAVSGIPYERFVTERLLRPLGMRDTIFELDAERQGRFAYGHAMPPYQRGFEQTEHQDLRAFSACGMLASTAEDALGLARLQWTESPLLPAATRDEMHRVHLMDPAVSGWRTGYGLGWRLVRHGDRVYASHGGAYLGNRCQMEASLADRVGVALFANRGGAAGVIALAAELLTETIDALGPADTPVPGPAAVPDDLAPLLGQYHLRHWSTVRIEHDSDGLRLISDMDGGVNVRLAPAGPGRFVIGGGRYVGEELAVHDRGSDGTVTVIRLAGSPMTRI